MASKCHVNERSRASFELQNVIETKCCPSCSHGAGTKVNTQNRYIATFASGVIVAISSATQPNQSGINPIAIYCIPLSLTHIARAHAQSVLADVSGVVLGALAAVGAAVAALPVITLLVIAAVGRVGAAVHHTLPVEAGPVLPALGVRGALRGDAAQHRHAVARVPVVPIVSARVALPALATAPHRVRVNVRGPNQGRLGIAKTPSAARVHALGALARGLVELGAVRLPLGLVTAVVETTSSIPHAGPDMGIHGRRFGRYEQREGNDQGQHVD